MALAAQPSQLAAFLRRYSVSILFPALTFGAIFADYNHNRKYKASQALAPRKVEEDLKE